MGTPSPKAAPQPESRRQAFEELGLLKPGLKAFGDTEPPVRSFARYVTHRFHHNSRDGGDLFQDLLKYLMERPDPLAESRADMARRNIDRLRWLKEKVWDLGYKVWRRPSNRTPPNEAEVIQQHEEYLLALHSADDDSIEIAHSPEVAAIRGELCDLFWKDLADDPQLQAVIEHIADMNGTCIKRKALANLLQMPIEDVDKILDRYAYRVKRFNERHHTTSSEPSQ